MLTQRQNKLLQYLDRQQRETGVTPSYDEMRGYMGLASKSGVSRLLDQLENRGFVARGPHHSARSLKVIHTLQKPVPSLTPEQFQFYEAAREYFRVENEEGASAKKRCARRAFSDMVHADFKNKKMSVVQ